MRLAPRRFGSRKRHPFRGVCVCVRVYVRACVCRVAHAVVIEVFTTRQKCDGTENVGDSDAWLNRLLCTGW